MTYTFKILKCFPEAQKKTPQLFNQQCHYLPGKFPWPISFQIKQIAMRKTNTNLPFHPLFLTGLAVLLLNDAYWKWAFSNTLTGKLSDFAGLLIFPIFLAALFPKQGKWMPLFAGLFFIYWKSPLSSGLIEGWNAFIPWKTQRVVDYSDWWALAVLPLSQWVIGGRAAVGSFQPGSISAVLKGAVLGAAVLAFSATTLLRWQPPEGDIYIGKSYTIKLPQDSILNRMTALGLDWQLDSMVQVYGTRRYYQVNQLALSNQDTLLNAKFYLYPKSEKKTELFLINVSLRHELKVQDWKKLRWLSRYYEGLVKEGLVEEPFRRTD